MRIVSGSYAADPLVRSAELTFGASSDGGDGFGGSLDDAVFTAAALHGEDMTFTLVDGETSDNPMQRGAREHASP